ncbi:MAG: hypothetical protein JXA95_08310 [Spirochaetales bacterium]|nr:hypothetical protein [Spirochaetales bacterium]
MKRIRPLMTALLLLPLLASCQGKAKREARVDEARKDLQEIAGRINGDFKRISVETEKLAADTALLYGEEEKRKNLAAVDKSRYQVYDNGVFYKPVDDGNSAVIVSTVYPLTQEIKDIVYFTEPLDQNFKKIITEYPEVVQVYYNDEHSYNRIYPFFDVITQYPPDIDIPSYNFYYLADGEHNPGRKTVWVNEPYVDPAGRGWMVSAIAPVYVDGKLVGVPGLDVTILTITERYIKPGGTGIAILDPRGTVVSIDQETAQLFALPPLENHKYLETIRQDTFRAEDFNLLQSKSQEVRAAGEDILIQGLRETSFTESDIKFVLLAESIPELDWIILKVVEW